MKIMHTAWRNMWRNGGRTVLSASAIFFSTLIVCLFMSLEAGYIDDMKANIRNHVTGDVRVMKRDYIENERITPIQFYVENTEGMIAALEKNPAVESATPRTEFGVAVYRNGEQIPCRALGVDLASSRFFSSKNDKLIVGRLPHAEAAEILVTQSLAKELELRVGSKITILSRTAISGSNGKTFTVSGVMAIADVDFSGRMIFMDWKLAAEYLRMNGNALQIQVFLNNARNPDKAIESLRAAISSARIGETGDYSVDPWHKVNGMYAFLEMANLLYAIFAAIFYALSGTVVFNTTMMSVFERKKEIGTLAALGMEKERIVGLFLTEAAFIAALGTFAGMIIGGTLVGIAGSTGIDILALYGSDFSGFSFSRIIYPALTPSTYLTVFLLGMVISIAACYLPARMAAKVEPAEALADR